MQTNRISRYIAATAVLGVSLPLGVIAHASPTSIATSTATIQINHKTSIVTKYTLRNHLVYLPVTDMQQLLRQIDVANTWHNGHWRIQTKMSPKVAGAVDEKMGNVEIELNGKAMFTRVPSLMTTLTGSNIRIPFVPLTYVERVLHDVGVYSSWRHATWNIQAPYATDNKLHQPLAMFSNLSQAKRFLLLYPGGSVQDQAGQVVYIEPSFTNVDLRYLGPPGVSAKAINAYLNMHQSITAGLGTVYIQAATKYGVNLNYLISHQMEETGAGGKASAIAIRKNNLYGYGAYDANAGTDAGVFPSQAYAIAFQAWEIRNNYLNPGASHFTEPTLNGIAQNYASDPNWANNIDDLMDQFAIDEHQTVQDYKQYTSTNQPTTPSSAKAEPIYSLVGARGTILVDVNYGHEVPVYATPQAGQGQMFVRNIRLHDEGPDVKTMQQALNKALSSDVLVDGVFGSQTQSALAQFQTAHGIPATGECNFQTWQALELSQPTSTVAAGKQVAIDQIVQGLAGNLVVEWFHIPSVGWINSNDVVFHNVYRVMVPHPTQPSDINPVVTNSTGQPIGRVHVGDDVVSNGVVSADHVAIQYVDAAGKVIYGYLSGREATLSNVQR